MMLKNSFKIVVIGRIHKNTSISKIPFFDYQSNVAIDTLIQALKRYLKPPHLTIDIWLPVCDQVFSRSHP